MQWPQIVIVIWWMYVIVVRIRTMARNRNATSGQVAVGFLITLAFDAAGVYVLHEGGFW